ncbi:MAG: flagellar hook-associated protein FlgK [Nitriliruptoraceae bacterium]
MSFVGLYTGLSGIRAGQAGLDTASNNIANANTAGYTRQRVDLSAAHTFQSPYGKVGTGVTVDGVARLRDGFLDTRFRAAVGEGAEASVRAEFLASMERLSGEPDLGISSRMGELWAAMEDWSNEPNSDASRRQVLSELDGVSETFRSTAHAWDQLGEDTSARLDATLGDVNRTLETLHEDFNVRLENTDPDRLGPEVLDQRDQLLDHLSELTGATVRYNDDQTVTVSLDGTELLGEDGPAAVAVDGDPASVQVTSADGSTTEPITASGELGGLYRAVHEDLPRWREQLDGLAETLATTINGQNADGALADGERGEDLLTFEADDPAGSLELVSSDIGVLAAGTLTDPPTAPAAHDGSNARAFADLRTAELDRPDDAGTATFESQLSDLIVGLAGDVRSSAASQEAAEGVATGAGLARSSQHGVSVDEEMVDMVRYQRAVEASARVMTTVDQMLDVLVNRVGIVGR